MHSGLVNSLPLSFGLGLPGGLSVTEERQSAPVETAGVVQVGLLVVWALRGGYAFLVQSKETHRKGVVTPMRCLQGNTSFEAPLIPDVLPALSTSY